MAIWPCGSEMAVFIWFRPVTRLVSSRITVLAGKEWCHQQCSQNTQRGSAMTVTHGQSSALGLTGINETFSFDMWPHSLPPEPCGTWFSHCLVNHMKPFPKWENSHLIGALQGNSQFLSFQERSGIFSVPVIDVNSKKIDLPCDMETWSTLFPKLINVRKITSFWLFPKENILTLKLNAMNTNQSLC